MRLAVLSDVHSNLEALNAVIDHAHADRIAVLGDLVGYGADPQAVVERLREADAVLLAGNHDMAVTNRFDLGWFNSVAAEAVEWTRRHLDAETYGVLSGLEPLLSEEGRVLVHGSVRDPAAEYLHDAAGAEASFGAAPFDVGFYGHTHVPFAYSHDGSAVCALMPREGESMSLDPGLRYLLNPGSVGQPRDGDARASYLIVEGEQATWLRVAYDVERAMEKIRDAGLPGVLADRLAVGR